MDPKHVVRGERVASAKLTSAIVRQIRDDRAAGATIRQLAKKYGVTTSPIQKVVTGETWRHVS